MKNALLGLSESGRVLLVALATVILAVFAFRGLIPVAEFATKLQWFVMALVGGMSLERAAEKFFVVPPGKTLIPSLPPPAIPDVKS